ncbi:MAG: hypothetical protein WAK96_12970, partial [Desulfobaccales bacterium]
GTDPHGNAVGAYSLSSQGSNGDFSLIGGYGYGGLGENGGGFGFGFPAIHAAPPQITPYSFARAIAMINYSNRLRSIKYDEAGGILEYDFEKGPIGRQSSASTTTGGAGQAQSFGHRPVE